MSGDGTEFGLFSDEGCVERGFYSAEEAETAIADRYSPDDDLHAGACCHDHPEHEAATCEHCNEQEGDEDEIE